MQKRRFLGAIGILFIFCGAGFAALRLVPRPQLRAVFPRNKISRALETGFDRLIEPEVRRVAIKNAVAQKIVAAAHAQEGDDYDASYRKISYPSGDVPKGAGACTDVVIRALRGAGIDLQQQIHADMSRDFARYGDKWKLGHTDKNIDHRRVPNQIAFFKKYGQSLPLETTGENLKTWQPGDIVMWHLPGNKWHTGIVSDGIGSSGKPLVIHNAYQCAEQDYLDNWPIAGHFRVAK
ncbi:hypothetical protein B1R32_11629 [Abditibacterium utsteinense]|uniref:DUF1287 domain-containing protein n=1 Tax=Abditibacterium utsteinense TaxID=1960156 RepID=A0A2S8SQH3_9BACT|nr:DUF1287 domain-containing protein [Abditibacterium utsteinense]PQV63052.1 hypothetical protein B1R32_11629 [Abditibacterium utsteinense]